MARFVSMTYGTLPTLEQFERGWTENMGYLERFSFGNDKRVGNDSLTQSELWREIRLAVEEFNDSGDDEAGDWASCVLGILGIEWI